MTTTIEPQATAFIPSPASPPLPSRLVSLDVFRGITITAMLLVNNPGHGGSYAPLEHAEWNGWTPTDLIFPFFIFIMGAAIPFSMVKRRAIESRGSLFLHVLARGMALFLLGELGYSIPGLPHAAPVPVLNFVRVCACVFLAVSFVLLLYPWNSKTFSLLVPPILAAAFVALLFGLHFFNRYLQNNGAVPADYSFGTGIFDPDHLRIPGVLQRIAVCYTVAATLALIVGWRGISLAALLFLALYSGLMLGVSYPSLTQPGQMTRGRLENEDNLARYVDVHVFGAHNYHSYPDPEGLLSTLPAMATALLGLLGGLWLQSPRDAGVRCAGLCVCGIIGVTVGEILNRVLMPINKPIWTPSYVFLAVGLAMLALGVLFYLCDILLIRRPFRPFVWYGMNAITAFVLAGIVARLLGLIPAPLHHGASLGSFLADHAARLGKQINIGDPQKNGSLTFAIGFVLFIGIVMAMLHRRKIFLKA